MLCRETWPILRRVSLLLCLFSMTAVHAAELSVSEVVIAPGATAEVVVSGDIAGESTFGLNILLEIVPRAGTTGTVEFTAVPADIVQLGDPWPGTGTFSTFEANLTESATLNGTVDDNGAFVAGAVTFSGDLASFRVVASSDAQGVWDVLLSTSNGASSWQGMATTLITGTVSVCDNDALCESGETCDNCPSDCLCDDGVACTIDTCSDGVCVNTPDDTACPDNGLFCDGNEVCSGTLGCVSTGNPCIGPSFCSETFDRCIRRPRPEEF